MGPTGATGSSGPLYNFVYRPGEPAPRDNVFNDWPTVVAAMAAVQGKKTLQFDNSLSPIVIPAGSWDMTDVLWQSFVITPAFLTGVTLSDGSSFPNLSKIGVSLNITNNNNTVAPIVFPTTGGLFEAGSPQGNSVEFNQAGTAPFFDLTNVTDPFGIVIMRMAGFLFNFGGPGAAPAINLGNTSGNRLFMELDGSTLIQPNMIAGVNTASQLVINQLSQSVVVGVQNGYAGTIYRGVPQNGPPPVAPVNYWAIGLHRGIIIPVPPNPASTVALAFSDGFSHGLTARLDATANGGDLAQTLPQIKSATTTIGGSGFLAAGELDSYGMWTTVKNAGTANNIVVSPDGTTPDTIDNGPGPVTIPPGGAATFMSDGFSNWILVSKA